MADPVSVAQALAGGFLAGTWLRRQLVERGAIVLGEKPAWLTPLARAVVKYFPRPPRGDLLLLRDFIVHQRSFFQAFAGSTRPHVAVWLSDEPEMTPSRFPVPAIATLGALAERLELSASELDWFADLKGLNAKVRPLALQHYHCTWQVKSSGGWRLLEAPKSRLKALQRTLLRELLDCLPPHEAAHGFVRGRSVLSFVTPHVGQPVVLRLDLRDFFASVTAPRVYQIFRALGYPDPPARALMGLCTTHTPRAVLEEQRRAAPAGAVHAWWRQRRRLSERHLPQGAPTSPALANVSCFRLDLRLAALARQLGASYTRYADDLAFSGGAGLRRDAPALLRLVSKIVAEEGFAVHPSKTKVMTQATRQQLAGLVVNAHPAVERGARKRLEAELHTAGTAPGADAQLRARLEGKLGWVALVHGAHAERLRRAAARATQGTGSTAGARGGG